LARKLLTNPQPDIVVVATKKARSAMAFWA